MSKYAIINYGEARSKIERDLTDEQAKFLNDIFAELETARELFAPVITMHKLD